MKKNTQTYNLKDFHSFILSQTHLQVQTTPANAQGHTVTDIDVDPVLWHMFDKPGLVHTHA